MGGFTQEIEIRKGEIVKYRVEEINLDFRAEDEDFSCAEINPSLFINAHDEEEDDFPYKKEIRVKE
ncbi:hypothetical protein [Lysinibacillus sp. G4S2]|uniref:hypothetical protein n=1 Tax=Lysinibacillus sp. G4S2 TaxID=3055859 RepID=UPI0025A239E8|nr:hypothetical protein [Lysinibacillus sp. G4S2]MDM5250083.1 hypothetical protein [Lysinibacillus sp. G4S2]